MGTRRTDHQLKVESLTRRKECLTCGLNQCYSQFYLKPESRDGRQNKCKRCVFDSHLRNSYGIDATQYHAATHCDACGVAFDSISQRKKHTDHCHSTGRVRGFLCSNCNVAEGHLDSPSLRKLADYKDRTTKTDLRTQT